MPTQKKMLVCDLDNTLYDWVHYFVSSFYAMVDEAVHATGCNREKLLDDFKNIHIRHHDSEHPFSLLETETIQTMFPEQTINQRALHLDRAFHAFNSQRKRTLKLHAGVHEGLGTLMRAGVTVVAHTESKLHAVVDRLTRLELTGYFSRIYCRERANSTHPDPERGRRWLDRFPMQKVIELSHHQRKPDPDVLKEICAREGVDHKHVAYVGDSIARDVLMAKKVGVFAIWARYGARHAKEEYDRLVRVSHWTEEDIEREKRLQEEAQGVRPDFVAEESFEEVLAAMGIDETNGIHRPEPGASFLAGGAARR